MPVAAVKPKRTLSDSEMMAYTRNRYADRKLNSRMSRISLEAQFACDRHHREISKWRSFREASAKTSGWSVDEYPDDVDEPVLSCPRPHTTGQGRNIRDFPPSRGSSRRASPARAESATELARSAGFHNEALSRLQKPWAYSYATTSYNAVYNESARSQAASLFLRYLAFRSPSASDVSDIEDSNNSAHPKHPRADVTRGRAKSNPAHVRRSSTSTTRCPTGCGSSLQGASRVRFDEAKQGEGRPRTAILVMQGENTPTPPRPSTVNGPAEVITNGTIPIRTPGSSDDGLADRETRPELPPLSRDPLREPLFISGTSDLVQEHNTISMNPTNVNGDIRHELDRSTNDGKSQDTHTSGSCYGDAVQNADVTCFSEEANSLDFPAQSRLKRIEQASLVGSPVSLVNQSQFDASDGHVDSSQNSVSVQFSLGGTLLRIPAARTKRQSPQDIDNIDVLKEDAVSLLAGTESPLKRDENLEEISADASTNSLVKPDVFHMSLNIGENRQKISSEVIHQNFVQSGPLTTKVPSAVTSRRASEAVARKGGYVRPQTTLSPHKTAQESMANRRPDRRTCSALPAVLESKASVGSCNVRDSVASTNGKEKSTKLVRTESEQSLAQVQSYNGMLPSHASQHSPELQNHRQSLQDSEDADLATLFNNADDPQELHPPPLGRRDSVDSDCTEFKGYRIHNYVRPQERYKADSFILSRRQRLLQRLSMERPVAMSGSRDHIRVEVVFPKQVRQRLLQQLVERNHRPAKGANPGIVHPVLRARIDEFYETLKPFCPSKEDQE